MTSGRECFILIGIQVPIQGVVLSGTDDAC
jgi:hypothetical protein